MKTNRILLLLALVPLASFAQDPIYLNANQSLLQLNPSFAGSNGGFRHQTSYLNETNSKNMFFSTTSVGVDFYIKSIRGGIGITALSDDAWAGLVRTNVANISYAQHLKLGENIKLIPSLSIGYGIRRPDPMGLHEGDELDPRRGFVWSARAGIPSQKSYLEASSGVLVNYADKLVAGATVFHLNQPDVGMLGSSQLPARLTLHGSYTMKLERDIVQFLAVTHHQNGTALAQINVQSVLRKHLLLGTGFTSGQLALISAGYRTNWLSVAAGYGYSLATSNARQWDIHAAFSLKKKDQRDPLATFETW